ncbi:hypothetical protein QBC47DRAFT_42948 [Echria macrotheca]|uniref:Uncharacterized protein n=1 Tax=Echria macrotheca TaxID=438768 RepID=A0AAJ0F7K1_9PEZI|nr:hypothetical protein QBC47DRAFT_42948 [Echria macrotheca]
MASSRAILLAPGQLGASIYPRGDMFGSVGSSYRFISSPRRQASKDAFGALPRAAAPSSLSNRGDRCSPHHVTVEPFYFPAGGTVGFSSQYSTPNGTADVAPARTNSSLPQRVCCARGAALLPMSLPSLLKARVCLLVASHRSFSKPRAAKVPARHQHVLANSVSSFGGAPVGHFIGAGGSPIAAIPFPMGQDSVFGTSYSSSLRTLTSFYPISSSGGTSWSNDAPPLPRAAVHIMAASSRSDTLLSFV